LHVLWYNGDVIVNKFNCLYKAVRIPVKLTSVRKISLLIKRFAFNVSDASSAVYPLWRVHPLSFVERVVIINI